MIPITLTSNDEIVFDVTDIPIDTILKLKERAELCPNLHKKSRRNGKKLPDSDCFFIQKNV